MIEELISASWHEAPEDMSFGARFEDVIVDVENELEAAISTEGKDRYPHATRLYIMTQALPRLILNYKIAVEFGLPLHPTEYFEFTENYDPTLHSQEEKALANLLFRESIGISRQVYDLDIRAHSRITHFKNILPPILKDFIYTNTKDKYTWQSSNPRHIKALADTIEKADLLVGAAHGCIRHGILLANLLDCDVYFTRFSQFKRKDPHPIIAESDLEFFEQYRDKRVILFDEDVAKGDTMKKFTEDLGQLFPHHKTASVLQFGLARFKPDYVGHLWYD